jgi:heat shock 70kDa protein 1/6/8
MRRLRTACERAKRSLSSSVSTTIEVDNLYEGIDFRMTLTRARFEDLCGDLFRGTLAPVETVLRKAAVDKSKIDEIVLVGGSTRIPKVQELLSKMFGGKALNRSINPDEAVAYGAAVQAAVLSNCDRQKADDILLVDVAPLSLGIETAGGIMTRLIESSTTIPTSKTQVFSTYADNQTAVTIQVYEGERARTGDNRLLGRFDLEGIPPAPRGVPQIEVSFDVNADGLLSVSAKDRTSGREQKITIKNERGRLSKEDIERMHADAKKYAAEDEQVRRNVEARNKLENAAYSVRNTAAELPEGSLTPDAKATLDAAVDAALAWIDANPSAEASASEAELKRLEAAVQPVLAAAQGGGMPGASTAPQPGAPIIDEVD